MTRAPIDAEFFAGRGAHFSDPKDGRAVPGGAVVGADADPNHTARALRHLVRPQRCRSDARAQGEQMHVWGVLEARALGAEQVLMDAGAHVAPSLRQYVEGRTEPIDVPSSLMLPGVAGMLNLRHPDACQALLDAAAAAGASVV